MAGQELPDRSKDQALELHDEPFNIVDTYYALLESDPELTMPIAAIEALVNLLTIHPSTTMAETLALIEKNTAELKASIPNSISLSAGTDLFQRYIVHSLNKDSASDFGQIREHLLKNGKKFVQRAKASRDSIANFGRSLVREDSTVMTIGGSRVVSAMLKQVARSGHGHGDGSGDAAGARNRPFRFKVIYVIPGSQYDAGMQKASGEFQAEGLDTVRELRELQVPVAVIPESAVAYSMGQVDTVVVGAEGVVLNGGIISRMGTYQMGIMAQALKTPFYVVAESHKFVRLYPLGQYDLPFDQDIIQFKTSNDVTRETERRAATAAAAAAADGTGRQGKGHTAQSTSSQPSTTPSSEKHEWAVDYTPPNLITAIITESGVLTPSAVSEELIKIWF